MNEDQELSPKYWIGHSKKSDDVFLDTASKGFNDTSLNMFSVFGRNWLDDEDKEIGLFELKQIPIKE